MSTEPELFAETLIDVTSTEPRKTSAEGTVAELYTTLDPVTGLVIGITRVVVQLPAGRMPCRWTGGFLAEVIATQAIDMSAAGVLIEVAENGPIVTGTIYPRAENQ